MCHVLASWQRSQRRMLSRRSPCGLLWQRRTPSAPSGRSASPTAVFSLWQSLALGRLVLALERERGERVWSKRSMPAERVAAEDVLAAPLVVGVAQLALLAERLGAGVHALALALPLGDRLVALEALVDWKSREPTWQSWQWSLPSMLACACVSGPGRRREEVGARDGRGERAAGSRRRKQRRTRGTPYRRSDGTRTQENRACVAFPS